MRAPSFVGSTHMFSCGIIASEKRISLPVLRVVHVDVTGLAAMDDDVDHLAALVLRLGQDRRAHGVEVPHVVRDVLEVPLVRALVEVDGDQTSRCTGCRPGGSRRTGRATDCPRRRTGCGSSCRSRASSTRRRRAVGRRSCLWRRPPSPPRCRGACRDRSHPSAPTRPPALLGNRVEGPQQLAVVRVEGLDEAADAVLAAVGADDDLAVDDRGRHRFGVAEVRISDLHLPQHACRSWRRARPASHRSCP